MPTATPSGKSTHHIVFTQGADSLGLILNQPGSKDPSPLGFAMEPATGGSLKIYSGNQKYSDGEPPWSSVSQTNWSGGRGLADQDLDSNRFLDVNRLNTYRENKVVLGGQTFNMGGNQKSWPRHNAGAKLRYQEYQAGTNGGGGQLKYIAVSFVANATYTAKKLWLIIRKLRTDADDLVVGIYNNSGGNPNLASPVSTQTILAAECDIYQWYEYAATITASLTSGTTYWIVINGGAYPLSWGVELHKETGVDQIYTSDNGSSWNQPAGWGAPFWLLDLEYKRNFKFLLYKRLMFSALTYEDGTAPVMYMNGDYGVVQAGATTTSIPAKNLYSWAADQAIGGILYLINGAASNQEKNWSRIIDNGATAAGATTFTVEAFDVAPGTDCEFVILATDVNYTVSSGAGFAANERVTDLIESAGYIYVCLGDTAPIARMNLSNSAGTPTITWADDGNNKAEYMMPAMRGDTPVIWRAVLPAKISYANAVTSWANLTFNADISVGDQLEKIKSLELFEDGNLWVLKEASIYPIINDVPYWLPIQELADIWDYRNCKASLAWNVYLLFSTLEGLQRYYNGNLDSIGPEKEAGLPMDRRGWFAKLKGYPSHYIGAYDGGQNNYSCVLINNGLGWHELWRGGNKGVRITDVAIQPIPGNHVNRLWISYGQSLIWIPFELDPDRNSYESYNFYNYNYCGTYTSGWYYLGLHNVSKLFHSIEMNLDLEDLEADAGASVIAYYRLDESTNWTRLFGVNDTTPYGNIHLEDVNPTGYQDTDGRRIQFMFEFANLDNDDTPRLVATVLHAAVRAQVRYLNTINFTIKDQAYDLLGQPDTQDADDKMALLKAWSQSASPVIIASTSEVLNGKYAFLDLFTARPYSNKLKNGRIEEGFECSLKLFEVY